MDRVGQILKLLLLLAISITPLSISAADSDSAPTSITSTGLQTNFGDVSYAGGMSYDSDHQILYVTGQVGSHSCFVGILKRIAASEKSANRPTHLEFLSRQVFDERAICQTIAFRKDVSRPGNVLLLSVAEEGGLLTDQREEGSRRAKQYGGLLDLQYSADGSLSEYDPEQSVLIYPAAVTIPRSITNDQTRTNRVFVATMTSDSTEIQYRDALGSPHVSEGGGGGVTTKPNLTPGGGMLKYGNNFAMTVESIRLATDFSGAEPQWRKPFGVKRNSDNVTKNGVTVNQILFRKGSQDEDAPIKNADQALYVVGSTLGTGTAFGEPEYDNDKGYGLVAGFITKLDPDDGSLITARRFLFNMNVNSESNEKPLRDTYIEAVCEAADDEDAIFVVGGYDRFVDIDRFRFLQSPWGMEENEAPTTESGTVNPTSDTSIFDDDGVDDDDFNDDDDWFKDDDVNVDDDFDDDDNDFKDVHKGTTASEIPTDEDEGSKRKTIATPFIAKLRASTLETIWQKDFESSTNSRALGCGVDLESNVVYVAGNVEDGGELVGRTTSLLGDDVFLMRLDTADGDVSWSQQIGTSKDDRLAYGGNGLVVIQGQQGVLLMGDTTSNLYSVSDQDSEIFIAEIDKDGNLPGTTEITGIDKSPAASLVMLSKPTKVSGGEQSDSGAGNSITGNSGNDNTSKPGLHNSADKLDDNATKIPESGHSVYFFVSICLVVFGAFAFFAHLSEKRRRKSTERALVFSYLQHFDLEDIDVSQAATGGWHGTYVGSLAEGVNALAGDTRSSSNGSWDCGNEFVEQKLSNLSHSSVVRDILFMDYDDTVFSSVSGDKSKDDEDQTEEEDGIVRDPIEFIDEDNEDDDRPKVDPWGTEII